MEGAFDAYSRGLAVVPPVGELLFEDPPGDVHIKYGYLRGGERYVVKIASGFYDNPRLGLPSSMGMMLLFAQRTGAPVAVLLDEGRLTDIRTAAAGAVAAKHLARPEIEAIGVVGTGIQARLQLEHLRGVRACRRAFVWGRTSARVEEMVAHARALGFDAAAATREELAARCDLIVTCTPAREALLAADWIRPGTHVTAVGSDTAGKQELDAALFARARAVADSLAQCRTRGELRAAIDGGFVAPEAVVELGDVVGGRAAGRTSDDAITVADLTGVAVQDLAIASAVFAGL
jgi:ornithine cyclodeaminase